MKILPIHLSSTYHIYIAPQLLTSPFLAEYCASLHQRMVIITDSHLENNLGKSLQEYLNTQGIVSELLAFPAGEIHKTRETKQALEDNLLAKHIGRDTCFIALGGGIVSDMVGFLAATYCRGVPVIYLPTTLLAMVDASIGGKTGVNTPYGKNLIGSFTQPLAVFIDTDTLSTLPEKEWQNGMAEIIKHSVIADGDFFEKLQQHSSTLKNTAHPFLTEMIYHSCLIKKNIVEQDEKDQGIRQLLNFGHTIGHAIETLENYQISHGEAIAIGMLVESYISLQHGCLHENTLNILHCLLQHYGLPLKTTAFQNKVLFQKTLMLDKKAIKNSAQFVLLEEIGKTYQPQNRYTVTVNDHLLHSALEWAAENF